MKTTAKTCIIPSTVCAGRYDAAFYFMTAVQKPRLYEDMIWPTTIRFLPDTTPKNSQWKKQKNYYGQSLGGTDFPDRWLVSALAQ